MLRFIGQVHGFRCARLHPVSHFEGVDASGNLGVAGRFKPHLVQAADRIERVTLQVVIHPFGIREVQDRVIAGAELDSLIDRRQEATAPVGIAAAGAFRAGREDDVTGEVVGLTAQTIAGPGAEARATEDLCSGVHLDLGGGMIKCISGH